MAKRIDALAQPFKIFQIYSDYPTPTTTTAEAAAAGGDDDEEHDNNGERDRAQEDNDEDDDEEDNDEHDHGQEDEDKQPWPPPLIVGKEGAKGRTQPTSASGLFDLSVSVLISSWVLNGEGVGMPVPAATMPCAKLL